MKRLIIFIAIIWGLQSCVKDKSDYYLNQLRDPDVVGVWMYDTGPEEFGISYRKYSADGKIYTGNDSSYNGTIIWNTVTYDYWYTKDGFIYTYRYYGKWTAGIEHKYPYHLSEDKTLLYIMHTNTSPPWTRVVLEE